jgi:hypothetical protein
MQTVNICTMEDQAADIGFWKRRHGDVMSGWRPFGNVILADG